jgi:hypothetical protein
LGDAAGFLVVEDEQDIPQVHCQGDRFGFPGIHLGFQGSDGGSILDGLNPQPA